MFVFWIFFFIFQFHCLDIYVVSPAISNCLLNSSCDGSKLTPFNDLYSAFQAGVSMAIKNNDPIINYYLLANEILTGFLLPNYTIYNGSGSLFEGYSGQINIDSYTLTNISSTLPPKSYIILQSDNLNFKILETLNIKNIVFMGFEMHMSKCLCIGFCCYPDTDSVLFDGSNQCSLEKITTIGYQNNVYDGFFQIGKKLLMNNVEIRFFNSFSKLMSLISFSETQNSEIILINVFIDQIYVPKSIFNFQNSSNFSVSLLNTTLHRFIMFKVLDTRFDFPIVIGISNSSGIVRIENSEIQYKYATNFLFIDESIVQTSILNFTLSTIDLCDDECFLISITNSKTSFLMSSFLLNTPNSLLSSEDNLTMILSEGILYEPKMRISGGNSFLILNEVNCFESQREFASISGRNNTLNILNSFFVNIYQTAISLYPLSSNNTIIIFNTTFEAINILLIYSDVYTHKIVESNIIDISFSSFSQIPAWSAGLIRSWRFSQISIKNCKFDQNTFSSLGIIMIYESFNSIKFENCSFNSTVSLGQGAIYSTCCWNLQNISLVILGCSFYRTISEFFGNIYAGNANVIIQNSKFVIVASFIGNLIYSIGATVKINNCSVIALFTFLIGGSFLINTDLAIDTAQFLSISGDEAALFITTFSNISMRNIFFGNSNFEGSFALLKKNTELYLFNCTFSNLQDGNMFYLVSNNTLSISSTNISNINFFQNGFIIGILNNFISIDTMQINDMSSLTSGTIIVTNYVNNISLSNLQVFNAISRFSALFIVLNYCKLEINNSLFKNCSSQGTGGVFFSSNVAISIKNCVFIEVSADTGGIIYSTHSIYTIYGSNFTNSKANYVSTTIYAENTSISLDLINFKFSNIVIKNNILESAVIFLKNSVENVITMTEILFLKDGNNSGYLLLVEGSKFFIGNSTFKQNSISISLLKMTNVLPKFWNIYFIENQANSLVELTTNGANITFENFYFFNNSFANYLIVIDNLNKSVFNNNFSILNFAFEKNSHFGKFGSFLKLINTFSTKITNVTGIGNLDSSCSLEEITFLYFSNCVIVFLDKLVASDNFYKIISTENSFLYVTNIISINNMNSILLHLINSEAIVSNSYFNDTSINLKIAFSFIKAKNSNLSLFNTIINSNHNFDLNHYLFNFASGGTLFIKKCGFYDDYSISVIRQTKALIIEDSFFFNQYGRLSFDNVNNILMQSSIFSNLGSISNVSINITSNLKTPIFLLISNSEFSHNTAIYGGALYLSGYTESEIYQSFFLYNQATMGASLYSTCLQRYQCSLQITKSYFKNNRASVGRSIFLDRSHKFLLSQNIFLNDSKLENFQKRLVYTSPYYLNLTNIIDEFGNSIQIGKDDQDKIIEINNWQKFSLLFQIYDNSNRKCSYDDSSSLIIEKDPKDSDLEIKGGVGYANAGKFQLGQFSILGDFNKTYTLNLQMIGNFTVTRNLTVHSRTCLAGEYLDSMLNCCLLCPIGFFSMEPPKFIGHKQEGVTSCVPCPENSICFGKYIAPIRNYWKSPNQNSTLLIKCPSEACLFQDFWDFNGTVQCLEGNKGALCIVCEDGYTKQFFTDNCDKCEKNIKFFGMMALKVGFNLLFVSYQVHNKLFISSFKAKKRKTIYLKIIRDHFNQIFLIFSISGVWKFNDMFSLFTNSANSVITGSTLNFNCFINDSMDMFFFSVLTITLSPIYMQLFISVIFFGIYMIKYFQKKPVHFKYFLETCFTVFIVVCDTQYTQILGGFFKLFDCTQLDSSEPFRKFLKFAPHIECYSKNHIFYLCVLGLPCLLIWILALPTIYFLLLLRMKNTTGLTRGSRSITLTSPENKKFKFVQQIAANGGKIGKIGIFEMNLEFSIMLSFLHTDFSHKRFYWSSIIMLWKIIMSILVTFVPAFYCYFSLFVFYTILLLIYEKAKPYRHNSSMFLVSLSFFSNMITVLLPMFNRKMQNSYTDVETVFYLTIQSIFFILAGSFLILNLELRSIVEQFGHFLVKKKNKYTCSIGNKLISFGRRNARSSKHKSLINQLTSQKSTHWQFSDTKENVNIMEMVRLERHRTEDKMFYSEKISSPNYIPEFVHRPLDLGKLDLLSS